ncbi:MAG: flagellar basal-body MS-ring/collar protein FliF [Rhodothermales bacterium]|nr:flagellar basal-body MS-ring/collar protein FliF [Rhodothermales bacterium]
MQNFLLNLRQFLGRLSAGQRAALGALLLGSVAVLGGVAYWTGQPDYTLLFGGLEPADASRIVESLNEQKVDYELRENGTAVFVPRKEVYELRLRFAGEGLVSDGPAGYELFDQGTLGMTDFLQKLNMKRALEGELARTVASIRQVEVCRVHLVVPERSPFRSAQSRPTASVVLQLVRGSRLAPAQIEGIAALVSGAVEGLDPADVTVLDARGNMLSSPDAGNPDLAAGSTQLRMQQAVETRLTEKGQTMLDQVLGPGNAIVRVAATLDFTRSVAEREVIDPESATVVSEEKIEEGGAEGYGTANSSVRNYELSRTRERSEKSVGEVADLSVSVILNYKKQLPAPDAEADEAEPAAPTFEPYPEEELQEIERLVKNAVGFQDTRGDRFALHQTLFDTSGETETLAELREQRRREEIQGYLRYGLMVLAMLAAAFLVRSATRRMSEAEKVRLTAPPLAAAPVPDALAAAAEDAAPAVLAADAPAEALPTRGAAALPPAEAPALDDAPAGAGDLYASKLSPEARARLEARHHLFEEVKAQIEAHPEDAADLIRSWILSDLQPEPARA